MKEKTLNLLRHYCLWQKYYLRQAQVIFARLTGSRIKTVDQDGTRRYWDPIVFSAGWDDGGASAQDLRDAFSVVRDERRPVKRAP